MDNQTSWATRQLGRKGDGGGPHTGLADYRMEPPNRRVKQGGKRMLGLPWPEGMTGFLNSKHRRCCSVDIKAFGGGIATFFSSYYSLGSMIIELLPSGEKEFGHP